MALKIVEKQDVTCTDVFRCFFNLNDIELVTFKILYKNGPMKADALEKLTGKNQSTLFRSLQKLVSCRMVNKEKRTIDRGGYYYVYSAVDYNLLQSRMKGCLDDWYERMNSAIENLDPTNPSAEDILKRM